MALFRFRQGGVMPYPLQKKRANSSQPEPEAVFPVEPVFWLDPSDVSTIILNGLNAEQWREKSVNENHATQLTPSNQPLYDLASINGLNSIKFDGINHFMDLNDFIDINAVFTIYMVLKLPSTITKTTFDQKLFSTAPDVDTYNITLGAHTGTAVDETFTVMDRDGNFSGNYIKSNIAAGVRLLTIKRGVSTISMSVDGIAQTVFQIHEDIVELIRLDRIGKWVDGEGRYFDGNMGEIPIFDVDLSTEDDATTADILMSKWGVGL